MKMGPFPRLRDVKTLAFSNRAVLTAWAAILSALSPAISSAQTITNVASVEWDAGDERVRALSNRVDIAIAAPRVDPRSLLIYHFARGPGGITLPVAPTRCAASTGDQMLVPEGAFAGIATSPATVARTSAIRAGAPLMLALNSPQDNRNTNLIDKITLTITTQNGDREVVDLTETTASSGLFTGMIGTTAIPREAIANDCRLSVRPGEQLILGADRSDQAGDIPATTIDILIDPFGIVFDSGDGAPVSGTRVTLIDADTGRPATVFGDDGRSSFPPSVVTGSTVSDSGGGTYAFPAGNYRFPFVRPGRYRLLVEPPVPYIAPSLVTPANLANLRRPDGPPFTILTGSYGEVFVLDDPAPVRIDIPVDKPAAGLSLSKTASQPVAAPGDAVQYRIEVRNGDLVRATGAITVEDRIPAAFRLRRDSIRYTRGDTTVSVTADGSLLTIVLPALPAAASGVVTYILEARPDAPSGQTMNRAIARDSFGVTSGVADAMVRIARDAISDRMTIIGRVTEGGCATDPRKARGIARVRVMLEDGSYSVSDEDGRYHFDGVIPGTHVVQMDGSTLPLDRAAIDCERNARSAGSTISRFVEGQGGALLRVDFRAQASAPRSEIAAAKAKRPAVAKDAEAAGAEREWLADQEPGIAWLFPEPEHNPRAKAVRVAIKHGPGQRVKLFSDGKPVDPLSFDGLKKSNDGQVVVSVWRGVELAGRDTKLTAEVVGADGTVVERLERKVHFSASPLKAEFLRDRSVLVADGVTRPVIAVRMIDRDGRPSHHGTVGDFAVPSPYFPAVEADAQQARQLSGLERARPVWRVDGDDGIAYIELEPTTASGSLAISFPFRDGEVTRDQRIDLWLDPGDRPWTVVGFAAGTAGFNTLEGRLEGLGADGDKWYTDARIALYAKGRVKGKWLLTLAYDSDKRADDARFAGTIDPDDYYTVYADRSERRYDAASVRRLYVKLERPQFYALFGDYETGISEPELARYNRALNGVKAEYNNGRVAATAFAADTPFRHRREEIQGNGLSGPYALAARDIIPNTERLTIEVRDRLRSDRIVESTMLVRHIDYDIDYRAGTVRFKEPVLSRSSSLDPQFIVVDYEVDGVAGRSLNAGGRVSWATADRDLVVSATAIHDEDGDTTTNLGGADMRWRPNAATEVRAEVAVSDGKAETGSLEPEAGTATAWLVEAEHHSAKIDILAYAREQEGGFGLGQQNRAETGTRKFGLDGRIRVTKDLSVIASATHEDYLGSDAKRIAGRLGAEYRTRGLDLRANLTIADDTLADGRTAKSTIAQLGATKRLFDNKLELDAQTEFALGGKDESIDFPARHRFGARYAINQDISLLGTYEIADGEFVDARTARIGFDLRPWTGARFVSSVNQQDISELGTRSFAAYGLSQSLPIGKKVTIDFTLDGNKTLDGGIDPARVLNPEQPVASGGFVGQDGTLAEDFTAVTAGATYRGDKWSATGRAEYRAGEDVDRYGFTAAALRQIGEGRAIGGSIDWFRAKQDSGALTQVTSARLSWAHRPANSEWSFLEKLELREDKARGAIAGVAGPIGGAPLTISGDARSRRVVNSLSVNWSGVNEDDGTWLNRSEVSLFWGARYASDKFDDADIKGFSNLLGADVRFDLNDTIEIGATGTIRESNGGKSYAWSAGPSIGITPFQNGYIAVGYNAVGFHDRDFADSRYTRSGPYVTLKLKFDQETLAGLGLGR